jgi:hypothetical protein
LRQALLAEQGERYEAEHRKAVVAHAEAGDERAALTRRVGQSAADEPSQERAGEPARQREQWE